MKANTFTILGLTLLLTLALVGTASADIGSEAGNWEYRHNAPQTKAEVAAQNYEYVEIALNKVSAEAGNWEYRFDVPKTATEIAAQSYQYSEEAFQGIGSEAGNWEYQFNAGQNSNKSVAEKENQKTLCSNC